MTALNNFLFIAFPYLAFGVFVVGSVYRYKNISFKVSSLSSQFLESKALFWGSIPFHIGVLVVLLGHVIAFLFPAGTLLWNAHPVRLIILEVTAFTFGLCMLFGLVLLYYRRATTPRIRMVSNKMDMFIELVLLLQVILGLWIALGYRWGSSWFAADLTPYLWSLVKFSPEISAVKELPVVIKLHIIGAFLLVLLIPFSRLVHFLVAPFHYIGRPYQRVIWYWNKKEVRDPKTKWSQFRPKNN
jgi:nitrate reductase gamma subunit